MPLEVSGSPGDFPTIAPFLKVGWFEQKPPGKKKVCLVREAKGTTVFLKIPENQRQKIKCGKQHFKAIGFKDGEYDWVASASDV
jgi:hypothetical protein